MRSDGDHSLQAVLTELRVIPVLTAETETAGLEACRALRAAGCSGVEITLRTGVALDVIAAVRDTFADFLVGAGTVRSVDDLRELKRLSVDFAVSPGMTRRLSDAAFELNLPLLPGVATASEILAGLEAGRRFFKLFPAQAVGGIPLLKSFASVFSDVSFCPTGGIGPDNFLDFLAQPNVACVGGSWMVASELLEAGNWAAVESLARACYRSPSAS